MRAPYNAYEFISTKSLLMNSIAVMRVCVCGCCPGVPLGFLNRRCVQGHVVFKDTCWFFQPSLSKSSQSAVRRVEAPDLDESLKWHFHWPSWCVHGLCGVFSGSPSCSQRRGAVPTAVHLLRLRCAHCPCGPRMASVICLAPPLCCLRVATVRLHHSVRGAFSDSVVSALSLGGAFAVSCSLFLPCFFSLLIQDRASKVCCVLGCADIYA